MKELVTAGPALRSFCTLRLEQRLGGIEVAQVREVSPNLPTTPVPQAPPAIRGLVNLRSRIFLVLDPRPLLGFSRTECNAESRLIILKPEIGRDVAILAERGGDIVHVKAAQIEPAAGAADTAADGAALLSSGICKLETELMMIVDPTRLIDAVMRLIK